MVCVANAAAVRQAPKPATNNIIGGRKKKLPEGSFFKYAEDSQKSSRFQSVRSKLSRPAP